MIYNAYQQQPTGKPLLITYSWKLNEDVEDRLIFHSNGDDVV